MNREELQTILANHALWLADNTTGARANLRSADLSSADLSSANLRSADLGGANLSGADLSSADLSSADLSSSDLSGADLSGANLYSANLRSADLSSADLSSADLRSADLGGANLCSANLRSADLSSATGLPSAIEWLAQCETCDRGWIVYKRIGSGFTQYNPPASWVIEPGSILAETVNPDRCTECGSGVNFGTREWCDNRYPSATLWRCLIRWQDGPGVVVPFSTDGKARCERLQLLEIVEE